MKRIAMILGALLLLSSSITAQQDATVPDSTTNGILNELQIIRGIHEETRAQRQRAIDERQKRDSILNRESEEDLLTDYGVMARIEDNTHQRPMTDGWNLYGIAAFAVAVLSAALAWHTFKAQQKTESNTKKLSQDTQRHLLNELLRHLYRDYVIIYTMRTKMEEIDYAGYPSEEHYVKLKIPMENIHLDAFYGEDEKFRLMHVLYLNLRNFNVEVDVALQHAKDRKLSREVKDEDFDTLEFKVSLLSEKIIKTINQIWGNGHTEDMKTALQLSLSGKTNAKSNIDVEGSDAFRHLTLDELKKTAYALIYSDKELADICDTFNNDVREERKLNQRGAWKVRIIR